MLGNVAEVSGQITRLDFEYTCKGEDFYRMELSCSRESGIIDPVPVTISERVPGLSNFTLGDVVKITGDIRTHSHIGEDKKNHLKVFIFAQTIEECNDLTINNVAFKGFLTKQPNMRKTPFGKSIVDFMVAINHPVYKKSYYVPCIAWGRNSFAIGSMKVGDMIVVTRSRFQARTYEKVMPDGQTVKRTAYEVSISEYTDTDD